MSAFAAIDELSGEVQALVSVLRTTEARLREITKGQVDAVTDADGRTFLLQTAQDSLRLHDAARREAILNALPANIALLDADGFIVAVNESWRRFGASNGMRRAAADVGANYLDACRDAQGVDSEIARQVSDGLTSVLSGARATFSAEYACHSPNQQRWFVMTATPLSEGRPGGVVVMHLDVTARKITEIRLQASEAHQREAARLLAVERSRLVAAQSVAKVGSWETDLTNMRLTWSDEMYRIHEMDPGASVSHAQLMALVHPDDRTGVERDLTRLLRPDALSVIRHRLLFPDRRVKYIEKRWHAAYAADGRPVRLLGTCQDITEARLAELALEALSLATERRERLMGKALSSISDFFYVYDRQGAFVFANRRLLDLWGLELDQVVGRTHLELGYPEPLATRLQQQIERVYQTGESLTDETEYTGRDGKAGHYEYVFSAVLAPDGRVESVVGSTRDVTERKMAEKALRLSMAEQQESARLLSIERSRLLDAQRMARIGNWETDLATMCVTWSEESHRIHETDPADGAITHDRFLAMVHPLDRARVDRDFRQSLGSTGQHVSEHRLLFADGRVKYMEAHWALVFDAQGAAVRVVGTHQDISERKLAEVRIQRLNRGYRVLSQINELIVRVDSRQELFEEACRIAVEAGHFPLVWIAEVDVAGQRVVPRASMGADSEFLEEVVAGLSLAADAPFGHGPTAVAVREKRVIVVNDIATDPGIRNANVHLDRGIRALVSLPLMVAGEVVAVLGLEASDVDYFDDAELTLLSELAGDIAFAIDHIGQSERLSYVAYYDALTGLANRQLFSERATQCLRSASTVGQSAALVLIDLERFKGFNDSLGQAAGDALLRHVGAWLADNLPDASLLGRVGADVFAFMLVDSPQAGDAARHLQRLIQSFHTHPFDLEGEVFRIAAKFGVAMWPDDAADSAALFQKAESALKSAKAAGDRHLFYTQTMTESVARRLSVENQLRHALDNEEFVLHFQPKVCLRTGRMSGAEALIRWNDPRTGLVPPNQFIGILEETGLINDVGRWALRKALAEHLRWREAGLAAPRIAVNVSPLQLRDSAFVAEVGQLLSVHPSAAEGLELEITEGMIMADIKRSISSLQALRDLGVRIAIDDFGTGFSSLGYLSKLPVDSLKIDRSFVNDMPHSPEGLALVQTIINLAHSMHLKVIAEGVETDGECGLLKLLRCDEMQGYLYSRPVPADEFEARFLRPQGPDARFDPAP